MKRAGFQWKTTGSTDGMMFAAVRASEENRSGGIGTQFFQLKIKLRFELLSASNQISDENLLILFFQKRPMVITWSKLFTLLLP